jgi:formylglycine-generating enzyme required for sulfatase activity
VTAIVWASPLGETRYAPEQLPLEIGGSERDDLRIEGVGEATVAVLGSFDGRVFVRSTPSADVSVNDAPLVGSHFLVSRDSIRLGSTRIRCEERDGALALVVTEAGAATPAGADAPAAGHPDDRDDPVVPVEYQPVVQRQARTERRGPDWRVVGIGATAALLGVLLWFSLTAVSVRVASDPPADDLDLPRTLLKLQLGDRLLVRPGEHRLVVEKQGYYTLESVIEVGEASSQQLEFTLEKRPGLLRLTTEPDAGALVSVDGTEVGTTPLEPFELRPGSHALQIQAPRYVTWEGEIEIEGGDVEQALALELTQAWSSVSVTSTPPGAALRVGDEDLGTTPLTFELLAGEYELEAALAGYKRFATALHVDPNRPLALDDIVLELADARLRLTSEPAGAQVMVDESLAGRTPLELELATGEPHTLTLFKPGFELVTREVELERGEERELSLQLPPRYGVIELQLSPPDAEVTVAGLQVDASTGKLRLLALPQQIRVSKSGYAPRTLGVTPRPGAPQRLEVRLLTLAEHQKATTKREIVTRRGQTLRLVGPGSLVMGAPRGEPGRRPNENQVSVELTQPFYIGVREITNREFREFRPEPRSSPFSGRALDGPDQPVTSVSWQDAARYCNWLSGQEGLPPAYVERAGQLVPRPQPGTSYRLPTEAEWTWVARYAGGGESLRYPWGDELPPPSGSGNYADVSASSLVANAMGAYNDGFVVTAPVGSSKPNAVGVFDLGGNVAEWMQDFYTVYPRASSGSLVDPSGPADGAHHVIRGSSWMHWSVTQLRFAYRDYGNEGRVDVGFRIARYAH